MLRLIKKGTSVAKQVKKKTSKKTASGKTVKKKAAKKAATVKATTKRKKKAVKSTKTKATVKKKVIAKKSSARKTSSIKSSSGKTTAPKTRKRKRKSVLSAKDMAYFRGLLVEKLKEILGSVNHIETEALKTSRLDSTGDLSSMPIHMADLGSDNYEQEFALGLMDSERKIVHEIHEALKRIQNKTYGICEGTFEPIPKMRLEGIPWTRFCVQYAELLEKGLVEEPEQDFYDDDYQEDDLEDNPTGQEDDEVQDEDERKIFFYGYDDDEDDDEEEL